MEGRFWCRKKNFWTEFSVCVARQDRKEEGCVRCKQFRKRKENLGGIKLNRRKENLGGIKLKRRKEGRLNND